MKPLLSTFLVLAVLPVMAIESTKQTREVTRPQSVFERLGKDPFAPVTKTHRAEKASVIAPSYHLSLKGVTIANGKRYALISGESLTEGESGFLKSGNATMKMLCKEIRENSVMIQVGSNTPIELNLGNRIDLDDKGTANANLAK